MAVARRENCPRREIESLPDVGAQAALHRSALFSLDRRDLPARTPKICRVRHLLKVKIEAGLLSDRESRPEPRSQPRSSSVAKWAALTRQSSDSSNHRQTFLELRSADGQMAAPRAAVAIRPALVGQLCFPYATRLANSCRRLRLVGAHLIEGVTPPWKSRA